MSKYRNLTELEKLIARYRKRLGIPERYILYTSVVKEKDWLPVHANDEAYIRDSKNYPKSDLFLRYKTLKEKSDTHVRRLICHELLHIIIGTMFQRLKPNYSYGKQGKVEEELVILMSYAIVPGEDDD